MPITFMDSFRMLPDTGGPWTVTFNGAAASPTITRVPGPFPGTYAMQYQSTTAVESNTLSSIRLFAPTVSTTFSLAFAYRHPPVTNATTQNLCSVLTPNSSYSYQNIAVRTGAKLSFGVASGGSIATVLDQNPQTQGWAWWNILGVLDSATAGYVRIYRNGLLVGEAQPDTALNSGSGGAAYFDFGLHSNNHTSGNAYSCIVLRNDTSLILPTRVDGLLPNADASVQFTPSAGANWECVSDEPTSNAADYVSSSTVGATDLYDFEPLPVSPPSIDAVQVRVRGYKSDISARTAALVLNGVQGTVKDWGTSGLTTTQVYATNPSGGAAWSKALVDAVQAGFKVVS